VWPREYDVGGAKVITDILYRCPACGCFDWLQENRCEGCGARLRVVSRTCIALDGHEAGIDTWYDRVLGFDIPEPVADVILRSRRVRMSCEVPSGRFVGLGGMTAARYERQLQDHGYLELTLEYLHFCGEKTDRKIPVHRIRSITIESNTVILIPPEPEVLFFDFLEESGKKWEDILRKAIQRGHDPLSVEEFFPRLRRKENFPAPRKPAGPLRTVQDAPVPPDGRKSSPVFRVLRLLVRQIIRLAFPIRVQGLENLPESGPAVVVGNHTSFIDGIVLEVFPARLIRFMTKNSQYKGRLVTWFLTQAGTFPVRRYTIDAQAVRNAIRVVRQGHLLGVFPEGERSWDGRMLPFKRGAIRLLLTLGVPVVPVGVSGAYGLMPRWTASIRRVPVTIRFGKPVRFEPVPIPNQTPALIDETAKKLKELILEQMEDQGSSP
jgi:1-acyl-sn-glycerol-3-phosphate acyltransferase